MNKTELEITIHDVIRDPIGMHERMYNNDPYFRKFVEENKDKDINQLREENSEILTEICQVLGI